MIALKTKNGLFRNATCKVSEVERPGTRIKYRGNPELEKYLESFVTGKKEYRSESEEIQQKMFFLAYDEELRQPSQRQRTENERFETRKKKKGKMKEHEILNDGFVNRNDSFHGAKKEQKKGDKGRQREKDKKNKTKAINREKKANAIEKYQFNRDSD